MVCHDFEKLVKVTYIVPKQDSMYYWWQIFTRSAQWSSQCNSLSLVSNCNVWAPNRHSIYVQVDDGACRRPHAHESYLKISWTITKHKFSNCYTIKRATEPGFAGDIGTIEIWLIYRLIENTGKLWMSSESVYECTSWKCLCILYTI